MADADPAPLYHRLLRTAAQVPHALALQTDRRALCYAELVAEVGAQAGRLRAMGLGAGDIVGWLGHNSLAMLATLLACARLGALFAPLNWRLAAPELAAIAGHAGLSVLLHDDALAPLADQVLALAPCQGPHEPVLPGDLLLVYTSGTTGAPKAAVHHQAGMLANVDAALAVQPITAASRVLAALPMFHVGGLCIQLLPALMAGAAVRLQARFEPGAWLRDVARWQAHTSVLVPAAMRALVEHPDWVQAEMSSLRFVNSGSQPVPRPLIQTFHDRGVPVAQVYGSTESGPVSIAIHPAWAMEGGSAGLPAPGVQVRLIGQTGAEVADGEMGEIHLKAANLMRGYHREPDHPDFQQGWLATGDLGRRLPDGRFEVVGRRKDLIISGGENILPAEIEALVQGWPGVAECAVLGLPDARWGEVPMLVLVAVPGAQVDLDGLRRHFDQQLARFKHPQRIEWVDSLPRTALGKVQNSVLLRLLPAQSGSSS